MQADLNMDTLTVQLTHKKALKLLLDLEELRLIRVIKKEIRREEKPLSEKYAGKIPADIGEQLMRHVEQSRDEWERNTY